MLTVIGVSIFAMKGLMTINVIGFACATLPGYMFGMWAGNRVFPLASQETFRRIAFALIMTSIITGLPIFDHWFRIK